MTKKSEDQVMRQLARMGWRTCSIAQALGASEDRVLEAIGQPIRDLTEPQIQTARDLWRTGNGTDRIAQFFGVPEFAIYNALPLIRNATEDRAA
jgi:hypothetical protein